MGRGFDAVARRTMAVLLAVGVLVMPGSPAMASVVLAADCPSGPVTIGKLTSLDLVPGNACYGGRLLTFRAYVEPPCDGCGGTSDSVLSPRWLDGLFGSSVALSNGADGGEVAAYVPPALGSCYVDHDLSTCPFRWYWGRWATVTAHFDGPVAQTCRYAEHPPGPGYTRSSAIAECRTKLIVLSVGFGPLPATTTVAVGADVGDGPSTALPWVATFAVVSLLLASRWTSSRRPAARRRPSR
jgi:hypothetical protein